MNSLRTIFKIAKAELNNMFYSPIAWLLAMVFVFQCGLTYTQSMESILTQQELGGAYLKYLGNLTSRMFSLPFSGLFPGVLGKLFLYLPLLTMGLISRESGSGTIKLLYSSPVRIREIVFGKYLAMVIYSLLLVAIIALFVILGCFNISAMDVGMAIAGLIGLFLLLCTYAAIGLFMSSLTTYQVVAGIGTLVMLAALNYIGTIGQGIDFVRDLTYFLSISGRAEQMTSGLISSKDVLYFLIIAALFLGFTICKMRGERETISAPVKAGRYLAVAATAILLGYITSRPALAAYIDTTAQKKNTLTENSQRIIKEMGSEPLEIITYVNLLDNYYWAGAPEQRNRDMERWEEYVRFKPDIKFRYVYYYDSAMSRNMYAGQAVHLAKETSSTEEGKTIEAIAKKYARTHHVSLDQFKTPEEIRKEIDLRPELNRFVRQLKYKGRSTFLRIYEDNMIFPSETETSAALKRLLEEKMPKIAFLDGHFERSIRRKGDKDYALIANTITFRHALVNQGFDAVTVNLEKEELPTGIATLVIADPRSELDSASLRKITNYIAEGGNLLIAGEPGKQAVVNPLLQTLGVQLREGMLVQQSKDYAPDMTLLSLTDTVVHFYRPLEKSMEDSLKVCMRGTAALSYSNDGPFRVQPLLVTNSQNTWLKKDELVADSAAVVYAPQRGDEKGLFPTALSLTRQINGKEQRIIVTGDADFMSTAEVGRRNISTANFNFHTGLFSWLCYNHFPIDTYQPDSRDKRLTITDAGLTRVKVFSMGVLPGLILLSGSIFLIRRKRK